MKKKPPPDLFDWTPPPHYPEAPGHVKGSETSKAAAEGTRSSASSMRAKVWAHAFAMGGYGIICDEIEVELRMRHQTASARIRELELSGDLIKTPHKRLTRSNSEARVYVAVRKEQP